MPTLTTRYTDAELDAEYRARRQMRRGDSGCSMLFWLVAIAAWCWWLAELMG